MIFDSDEQRKAVFASIYSRKEFRDRYHRSRGVKPVISSLESQIRALRRDRGDLKREIETAEQMHQPHSVLKIKRDKLAEIDAKIVELEAEKRRFQQI